VFWNKKYLYYLWVQCKKKKKKYKQVYAVSEKNKWLEKWIKWNAMRVDGQNWRQESCIETTLSG
jgi:hypothetical protein